MPARYFFDGGSFEPITGRLMIADASAQLRPRTAAVFECLVAAAGRVVTRQELFETVWHDTIVGDESLGQCLKEIRHGLGDRAGWIRTVPRVGYAFTAEVSGEPPAPPDEPTKAQPRRIGRRAIVAGALAAAAAGIAAWWFIRPAEPAPFSVVVLPFQSQEPVVHVADAITDALTTDLARIPGSFVIARSTAATLHGIDATPASVRSTLKVRYLLEGAVHVDGRHLQVDARLVDSDDGRVIWSDRLDAAAGEVEVLSLGVVGRLARSLHMTIIDAEAERARRRGRSTSPAYDLTMRGWSAWNRHTLAANHEARAFLQQAVAIDPGAAMAWAGLANTYISEIYLGGASQREMLPLAHRAAAQAYALDPAHVNTQGALATVLAMEGQLRESLALSEAMLRTVPSYAPALMWSSIVLVQLDQPAQALDKVRQARRMSPRDPRLAYFMITEARALVHLGRDDESIEALREALRQPGLGGSARPLLAAVLYRHGQQDEARRVAAEHLAAHPEYRLASWASAMAAGVPVFREREQSLLEAAAAAGLPQ